MSEKYFDMKFHSIKLRSSKYKLMDQILRAYNRLHNKDYNDEYRRNPDTFDMLKDVEIIQPNITEALKEEVDLFNEVLNDKLKHEFEINEIAPHKMKLRVGSWWKLVLNVDTIYTEYGEVNLIDDPWGKDSTVFFEGEGYSSTKDCDAMILIKLENSDTSQEESND